MKTPVLESLINKVVGLRLCSNIDFFYKLEYYSKIPVFARN